MTAQQLINQIQSIQDPEKAKWLENYVKHDVKSYGVGIPEIRTLLKEFNNRYTINHLPVSDQVYFLDELMGDEYTEPKLAAILYIQLYWTVGMGGEILRLTSRWLDNHCITDWNVCDWLCVRLLSPLLDQEPALCISTFSQWNENPNVWKARSSLVPFAQCKTLNHHTDAILKFSQLLIRREERFCKTAVGWVLRHYSKIDEQFVLDFLSEHEAFTTKEVIKNATKYV